MDLDVVQISFHLEIHFSILFLNNLKLKTQNGLDRSCFKVIYIVQTTTKSLSQRLHKLISWVVRSKHPENE